MRPKRDPNIKPSHNMSTKHIVLDSVTLCFLASMRSLRNNLGLTLKKVAKFVGVSYNSLSGYESGKTLPNVSVLVRLAEILGFDMSASINYVLSAENSANKFASRREDIKKFMDKYTALYVSDKNRPRIELKAVEIMKSGLKFMDACHIACAIFAGCDYFLSVDDRVLRFKTDEVKIMNPVDFISELEMIL